MVVQFQSRSGPCWMTSLRWGEATALRRCDLDLEAGIVRGVPHS